MASTIVATDSAAPVESTSSAVSRAAIIAGAFAASTFEQAKVAAQEAADTTRKAGATFALVGSLSLIIGAFIASAAAALGGKQRDEEDAHYVR